MFPKTQYVRDKRLQLMCRGMACQRCGAAGEEAGVTWAHSNQMRHGKGRGIKASDIYVAALCHHCHHQLDQGFLWSRAEKEAIWWVAHEKTVTRAIRLGLWPKDIELPEWARALA